MLCCRLLFSEFVVEVEIYLFHTALLGKLPDLTKSSTKFIKSYLTAILNRSGTKPSYFLAHLFLNSKSRSNSIRFGNKFLSILHNLPKNQLINNQCVYVCSPNMCSLYCSLITLKTSSF